MERLSVVVTTFNNERTLPACLESVKWADEIFVLDSFSTDGTLDVARRYGARIDQHEFLGFERQKQMALDRATHRWVLLLDADEMLTPELQQEIRQLMREGPDADGYTIGRVEQLFWRMSSTRVRLRHFCRLFDRQKGRMSENPIHAAPVVDGVVKRLRAPFYHFGVVGIHGKVAKINDYSTALVADKLSKGRKGHPLMVVFYPPLYFLRQYLLMRNFLNGRVGFIISVIDAFYVFLKYAKLHEHVQLARYGDDLLPHGAPKRA